MATSMMRRHFEELFISLEPHGCQFGRFAGTAMFYLNHSSARVLWIELLDERSESRTPLLLTPGEQTADARCLFDLLTGAILTRYADDILEETKRLQQEASTHDTY